MNNNKNITNQIGGKGTIRHQRKKFVRQSDKTKNKINSIIKNINLKIVYLNFEKKKEFTELIQKDMIILLQHIKKEDIIKNNIKFADIKSQGINFLNKLFFYIENDIIILIKETLYENINRYFINQTKEVCYKFILMIDNLIKSSQKISKNDIDDVKIYEQKTEYNKDSFNESLKYFNINISERKIHFKQILEVYSKKKQLTNDDIQCDIHFQRLKNQYQKYLLC